MSMHIEWRDLCLKAILADGKIDDPEVALLKKELKSSTGGWYAEGVTFLVAVREAYTKKAKAKKEELSEVFEKFFFKVVQEYVLKDGDISDHEAGWMRDTLFADGKIDAREWDFLQALNKKAGKKSNAFIQLYADAEKKHKPAAAAAAPAAKGPAPAKKKEPKTSK